MLPLFVVRLCVFCLLAFSKRTWPGLPLDNAMYN